MPYCIICGSYENKLSRHLSRLHKSIFENAKSRNFDNTVFFIKEPITKSLIDGVGIPNLISVSVIDSYKKKLIRAAGNIVERPIPVSYSFVSNGIKFKDGEIIIFEKNRVKLFTIKCKKSVSSLNLIRDAFYKVLFDKKVCKLVAVGTRIVLEASPDIDLLVKSIEKAVEMYQQSAFQIRRTGKKKGGLTKVTLKKADFIIDSKFQGIDHEKEPYFNFLFYNSDKNEKIHVVEEYIGQSKEQGLLFILKQKCGSKIIVWENAYKERATKVFQYKSPIDLAKLVEYIQAEAEAKREVFSNKKTNSAKRQELKRKYNFISSLKHDEIYKYKKAITNLKAV